jgi:hypothetical protein
MLVEHDAALLDRLLTESGVTRTAPAPAWYEYAGELANAFAEWFARALEPVARSLGARRDWLVWAAVAFVIVTLSLLLFLLGRSLLQSLRARRPEAQAQAPEAAPAPRLLVEPGYWRAELDRALGRGDVAAALRALWWWLGATLVARDLDGSWTSRELLERARRPDLADLAHALDSQLYGRARPSPDDVRRLAVRFEGALR